MHLRRVRSYAGPASSSLRTAVAQLGAAIGEPLVTVDDARERTSAGEAQPPFSALFVSGLVGPSSVLHLCGELDLESAPALRAALDPMARSECTITVDLGEVTFMDSSGVHVLVDAAQSVAERGPVVVLRASPAVRRLLLLCGVSGFFEHQ